MIIWPEKVTFFGRLVSKLHPERTKARRISSDERTKWRCVAVPRLGWWEIHLLKTCMDEGGALTTVTGWWQLKYFLNFHPETLGK